MSGTFPGTCICVWSKNNILLIFIHTHRIGCSTCLDCADLITSNPQNPHKVRYCNIIIIIIITLHTSTFNYSTVRYVVSCRVVSYCYLLTSWTNTTDTLLSRPHSRSVFSMTGSGHIFPADCIPMKPTHIQLYTVMLIQEEEPDHRQ